MKTLKFRAWDNHDKAMCYEVDVYSEPKVTWWTGQWRNENGDRSHCFSNDNGKNILMQYTGLLDKNGKEVYEGDIIRHLKYGGVWEVKWIQDSTGYFIVKRNDHMALSKLCEPNIEVIGNIYGNKELLEAE